MTKVSWKNFFTDNKKKRISAVGIVILLFAAGMLLAVKSRFYFGDSNVSTAENGVNLALQKGVTARCDSMETEELSADKAIDGDDHALSSRWSSENNWEDASHFIELEFPEEISVSFVVLKWERTNVISYRLEGSADGEDWQILETFDRAPSSKKQEIPLQEAVTVRFLRLSTSEVSKEEADYSNLYQNVSLFEFEVYADKPAAYRLETPEIVVSSNNERYLEMPAAPEGYRVTYLGADYEQIIGADGSVFETIQEKEVEVGFLVEPEDGSGTGREVSFTIQVPAAYDAHEGAGSPADHAEGLSDNTEGASGHVKDPAEGAEESGGNEEPEVIPAIAEWDGGVGAFVPGEDSRIVVREQELRRAAELFARRYAEIMGQEISVLDGTWEDVRPGDFYLGFASDGADAVGNADAAENVNAAGNADAAGNVNAAGNIDAAENVNAAGKVNAAGNIDAVGKANDTGFCFGEAAEGLGEEGYLCDITDKCVITGNDPQGIYWGTITALQILKGRDGEIPQGRIRDYPKYPVRGFGIDVARKPVSLAMLYRIMENMSWYKMNDFGIHLNDNLILSTSGLTGSVEEAMTAYSAFRIDSSVINEKGERLTSSDYAYTAEEFAAFIADAAEYGVRVVPEIDTPAHSLSITKLFPEYALTVRNEAVDQINLNKREAVELVKTVWREALGAGEDDMRSGEAGQMQPVSSGPAFRGAEAVNIGMDEYYGDGETYRKYMNELIGMIREESGVETIRLWGSLSNIEGDTVPPAEGLQMNIWSTVWADPLSMYRAGYTLINMQNNHLYIIPGGGYDYLDGEELFGNWEPNKFYDYNQLEVIPAYSPQMAGAAYMIWNDMSGRLDVGISEPELFDRFFIPLGVIGGKLWGETEGSYPEWMKRFETLGTAPGSNPYGLAEWEGDTLRILPDETLSFSGNGDYVQTGYTGGNGNGIGIGGSYTVRMEVYREASAEGSGGNGKNGPADNPGSVNKTGQGAREEILFETDCAYGQTAFKAVQTGTGQVGFSREGKDYSFDYTLPAGEWVSLEVRGEKDRTSLYVNGKLADTLGNGEPFGEYAAFVFPLERIGSVTNGFCGMIKEIEVETDGSLY